MKAISQVSDKAMGQVLFTSLFTVGIAMFYYMGLALS